MKKPVPPRIYLLAAQKKPVVVLVMRVRVRVFHIVRWKTSTDEFEHGSWFRGNLYPLRADVSFDGRRMVYLAMSKQGNTWNGVCKLPWLRTVAEFESVGSWYGGGCWLDDDRLAINAYGHCRTPTTNTLKWTGPGNLPFRIELLPHIGYGEDEGVLYQRLRRDGWRCEVPMGATGIGGPRDEWTMFSRKQVTWCLRPSEAHPTLRMGYLGYHDSRGRIYSFSLDQYPGLIQKDAMWACWDAIGQLIVSRPGIVERYTLDDFDKGRPSFQKDFAQLEPPARGEQHYLETQSGEELE
ncbi:MAG: hypothetical protein B6D36_13155 [Planctomycetes bacterium UTPLA1]|nr:MAG: hypothetical protein B6D36_13155 [Planctomycetes bacterium UTPLA1]